MTKKILRLKELSEYIGLSRTVIYERMDSKSPRHDPSFPKSFSLGGQAVGWHCADVDIWLAHCSATSAATKMAKAATVAVAKPTIKKFSTIKHPEPSSTPRKKKTPGSLASMILDGGDINERILTLLQMPTWTPAMGVLIVCGISPEANCTEIPLEGVSLDDKPIKPASPQLMKARQMLEDWYEWVADEAEPITEMPPGRFLYWCQESDIDTDWLRLCLELWGFRDESKTDLTGARFALLTSK